MKLVITLVSSIVAVGPMRSEKSIEWMWKHVIIVFIVIHKYSCCFIIHIKNVQRIVSFEKGFDGDTKFEF